MKPSNTIRKPIDPGDSAGIPCRFEVWVGIDFEACKTDATTEISSAELNFFTEWKTQHPKAIIDITPCGITPVNSYLCDNHVRLFREIIGSG